MAKAVWYAGNPPAVRISIRSGIRLYESPSSEPQGVSGGVVQKLVLRLKSPGFSERNIARSCSVSRNTVRHVIDKANERKISWPLDSSMTDGAIEELLFPSDKSATDRRLPDYNYIRKELLRNGVTKKLPWIEYCEECRQAGENPLMYSQFCEYIHRDEQKRRATMHIPRKPGEQIEVDWAGDPAAHIIDPDAERAVDLLEMSIGFLWKKERATAFIEW